jgi:hypothetical protein
MDDLEGLSMVRTGTYFGECFTYCNETVTITPEKTSYALTSKVQDPQYPDIIVEGETVRADWEELQRLIDWAKFRALPSTIGQPDCADQGGEWVEVTVGVTANRIDFEMNALVPGIDVLIQKLREIRNGLSQKYRR